MRIRVILAWLGTFLGLLFAVLLVHGAVTDIGARPWWARVFAMATAAVLFWTLGGGVLRALRDRRTPPPAEPEKDAAPEAPNP